MSDTVVVDLSHWNATPDWPALKAGGIVGVILKCTQGKTYTDPTFVQRYAAAKAVGIAAIGYHFLEHGDAAGQMKFYLSVLKPSPGDRVVIDFEQSDCTIDDLHEAVSALLSSNVEITVYGSPSFLNQKLGAARDKLLAENTSLWIASYTSAPSPSPWPTNTWATWSLWQFSQSGKVQGLSGAVDTNRFNGSVENCVKWLGPAQPQGGAEPVPVPISVVDPPQPVAADVIVRVHVDAPPGVKVTVVQE